MFYSSAFIDERLKCAFCKKAFVDVVKLVPECGESICGLCYKELRENVKEAEQYNCDGCNEWHEMPKRDFSDNRGFMRMLEATKIEKPLSKQAKILKRFIDSAPSKLRALETFDELEHIKHYCDQLEVEVVEEIDSLVKHLNEIREGLLKQIREYRERCLKSLSARSSPTKEASDVKSNKTREERSTLAKDLKDFGDKWSDYFSRFDSFMTDSDIEAALNKAKHFKTRMGSLDAKLKSNALGGHIMTFRADHCFLGEHRPLESIFSLPIERTDLRIQQTPLATLNAHSDYVFQVLFLSDDRFASCSKDKIIKIWNVESRRLFELKGHSNWVNSLSMLQNGWLASGSEDRTIMIWDLEQRKSIKTLYGHKASVVSLKTLKNGNLVSYSLDDTIRIWNPYSDANNLILTISGHGNKKWIIPFDILSNDNVVTCSRDNDSKEDCVLRVWNTNNGALITSISTGCVAVMPILVLSNGQVALGFLNGSIKIVDLSDQSKTIMSGKAFTGAVASFEQMSNGNLISGGLDSSKHTIKVWNVLDLAQLYSIATDHSDFITSFCLSPNGQSVVTVGKDKTIKLWAITSP